MEWQPISTAPKDGTPILVAAPVIPNHEGMHWPERGWSEEESRRVTIAAWSDYDFSWLTLDSELGMSYGGENSFDFVECGSVEPTHWMPLPEPPKE